MNYRLTSTPALTNSECLVLGLCGSTDLPDFAQALDQQHGGVITLMAKKLTDPGDMAWHTDVSGHRLLFIQCGEKDAYTARSLTQRIAETAQTLLKQRMTSATLCFPQLTSHTPDWQLQHILLNMQAQRYQLLPFKTKKNTPHRLKSIDIFLPGASPATLQTAQAIAQAIDWARTLANFPANICTPTYLAQQATQLALQQSKIDVKVLNREQMQAMGMGALLAVAQGSHEPPQLIELKYHGAGNDSPPVVLVGKGITFDAGGISLKPADGMNEMKYDMAGAASVLGTLKACALLHLPINVVGLLACAENMPGGGAVKPGDIITTLSGQTVEIINTDAEGRLVLADALTYAERFKPRMVIDIATLTGAVIVALGYHTTGVMTNDGELAECILNASRDSDDPAWRLPMDEPYQSALDSPIADMINASFDRSAGSITGACFLSRFTGKYRWAHLDIAGTAWVSGKSRNATGRPVALLVQLLRDLTHAR
ncbi:MAG TPA: leucyl aminopeptidase [Legionella sp.]|nr:leucyl aminopeptidase [Legionella sp.]